MAGFTVQPESFGPVAQQMREAGGQLTQSWAPVQSQTESVPFGRGDDVVSPLIQVSLEGAIAIVSSCITSCADSLNGYADGLESMARTYTDVEEHTNSMLKPTPS